jgi:phenylacetic acid degradation operon negative regulatory protein
MADFERLSPQLARPLESQTSFVARTLLIHEFRRILLTDPDLPDSLLPGDWPGHAAAELTKALYSRVCERSTRYVVQTLENEAGLLPEPDAAFFRRFGRSGRR